MKGLGKGFALLREKKYLDALHCFKSILGKTKDPEVKKNCLYGKARAQIGLKHFDVAEDILLNAINEYPECELFYRALTRLYESQQQFKQAEKLYLKAVNHGCRSDKFLKQYEWFLLHCVKPVPVLPGFRVYAAAQLQQHIPDLQIQAVISPQQGKYHHKRLQ